MKRYTATLLISAMALAPLASCSEEERVHPAPDGTEVVFTVTPRIAAGYRNSPATCATATTAAAGTATSADGGVANLTGKGYLQRYILEVWSSDQAAKEYREVKVRAVGDAPPDFSPRLLAKGYRFVMWADFIEASSYNPETNPGGSDLFYGTRNLNDISLLRADCNHDAKDAYTAAFDADLSSAGLAAAVTLKRPLAKVRLVATDADMANGNAGLENCAANLAFAARLPQRYNALDGSVSDALPAAANELYLPVYQDYGTASGSPGPGNHSRTLAWDYVFVPADGLKTDITIRMVDGGRDAVVFPSAGDENALSKTIEGVALKPNTLTTAVGRYFTPAATVTR